MGYRVGENAFSGSHFIGRGSVLLAPRKVSGAGYSSAGAGGRQSLQPSPEPGVGLYGDLSRGWAGAGGVGDFVVEKAAQDAVGVSFSEREAVFQRRRSCVVLYAGGAAG